MVVATYVGYCHIVTVLAQMVMHRKHVAVSVRPDGQFADCFQGELVKHIEGRVRDEHRLSCASSHDFALGTTPISLNMLSN